MLSKFCSSGSYKLVINDIPVVTILKTMDFVGFNQYNLFPLIWPQIPFLNVLHRSMSYILQWQADDAKPRAYLLNTDSPFDGQIESDHTEFGYVTILLTDDGGLLIVKYENR